jgi:ABC-type nitrate/sulfonate/bicarbonate transport system substrate-binding protein
MNETLDYVRTFARFPFALRRFLRHTPTLDEAKRAVRERMERREETFLSLVERCVYGDARSPYLALLKLAGCELGDLRALVAKKGMEGALRDLREADVYVTFEEFKGRAPIVRNGRTIAVTARDFDNPFARRDFTVQTGGSTGRAINIGANVDHIAERRLNEMLALAAHGLLGVPTALWNYILPSGSPGRPLMLASIGQPAEHWFSPTGWRDSKQWLKYNLATYYMIGWMRLFGVRVPLPEVVRMDQALVVARWIHETLKTHPRCLVYAGVSRALRVCVAARDAGLDLTGAALRGGGEPLTPAKVEVMQRVGARYVPNYAMSETSYVGAACARPADASDVHVLKDAFVLFTHPHPLPAFGVTVPAFNLTTLLPTVPKLMFNVQVDDYGIVEERACGCELESYGYDPRARHPQLQQAGRRRRDPHRQRDAADSRGGAARPLRRHPAGLSIDRGRRRAGIHPRPSRREPAPPDRRRAARDRGLPRGHARVILPVGRGAHRLAADRHHSSQATGANPDRARQVAAAADSPPRGECPGRGQDVTMNTLITCVLVVLGGVMSACGAPSTAREPAATTESAASPATAASHKGTIRVSRQGPVAVRDVPWLMALDSLREQGYTVEIVDFAGSDLITEALLRGDLDIGSVNPSTLWTAIAKGAGLRTIGARNSMTVRLVVKRDIRTCRDLQHGSIAFNTTQGTNNALFDAYVRRHCPDITPRIVIIPESRNRMAALQTGEIDGAMMELDDWLYLDDRAPGGFHILVDVAREFSDIQISSFAVRAEWAKQNPDLVKDFLRTLVAVYRRVVENPWLLQEENARRLSVDTASAKRLTDAFLAANAWDLNGGWTAASVQATIDFLTNTGSLPAGLKAEDVADLAYLNAVLDEIGRQ